MTRFVVAIGQTCVLAVYDALRIGTQWSCMWHVLAISLVHMCGCVYPLWAKRRIGTKIIRTLLLACWTLPNAICITYYMLMTLCPGTPLFFTCSVADLMSKRMHRRLVFTFYAMTTIATLVVYTQIFKQVHNQSAKQAAKNGDAVSLRKSIGGSKAKKSTTVLQNATGLDTVTAEMTMAHSSGVMDRARLLLRRSNSILTA